MKNRVWSTKENNELLLQLCGEFEILSEIKMGRTNLGRSSRKDGRKKITRKEYSRADNVEEG